MPSISSFLALLSSAVPADAIVCIVRSSAVVRDRRRGDRGSSYSGRPTSARRLLFFSAYPVAHGLVLPAAGCAAAEAGGRVLLEP